MIELRQVQKVVGQNTVLNLEALQVKAGEIAAVLGPKGSGKAVLFDLLTGRTAPTAGQCEVVNLSSQSDTEALKQCLGVLFAENALYERLSVRANLRFFCRLQGLALDRAESVMAEVGLADRAGLRADKLPHSLARRLAFGRAILHQPQVLLLYEPFLGCDGASISLISRLLQRLVAADGCALILSTTATGLSDICQNIHQFEQGQITRSYSPQADEDSEEMPFKIPVRTESRVVLLNPADILYVSTQDGKTHLHTHDEQLPTQFTMTDLEKRLAPSGFFRAHRGYLVNLQRVKAVIPYTRNSFSLVLDNPASTEIPLSKTAARELRDLFDY